MRFTSTKIAKQQEKGNRPLNEIITMAKERVDELFVAQQKAAIERIHWLDDEVEDEDEDAGEKELKKVRNARRSERLTHSELTKHNRASTL